MARFRRPTTAHVVHLILLGLLAALLGACGPNGAIETQGDTIPPSITLLSPTHGDSVFSNVMVTGTVEDLNRVTRLSYRVDDGAMTSTSIEVAASVSFAFALDLDLGAHILVLEAEDEAGNVAEIEVAVSVEADGWTNTAPRIAHFGASAVSGASPLEVAFEWDLSDVDGDDLACMIFLGTDSAPVEVSCDASGSVFHTYAAAGVYTATLVVQDGQVCAIATVDITVSGSGGSGHNSAPTIGGFHVSPGTGFKALDVAFDWSVHDDDDDDLTCFLVFGDRSGWVDSFPCGSGSQAHTYLKAGVYHAALVVVDGRGGSVSATVKIVVKAGDGNGGDGGTGGGGGSDTNSRITLTASPTLLSISTAEAELFDLLIDGLLDEHDVTDLDWTKLSGKGFDLDDLLAKIARDEGYDTYYEVLDHDLTLSELFDILSACLDDDGDPVVADLLARLALDVSFADGEFDLEDLLDLDVLSGGNLAELALLDTVMAVLELYSYLHVAVPSITLDLDALDLSADIADLDVMLQVVEPARIMVAKKGSKFHGAALRLKVRLDLVDATFALDDLNGLLGILESTGVATGELSVADLTLYLELARVDGFVKNIDAITHAVTMAIKPGLADLYLGDVPDELFFNKKIKVTEEHIGLGTVGSLRLDVALGGVALGTATIELMAKAVSKGQAPLEQIVTFEAPFPTAKTLGSSADAVTAMVSSLIASLEIDLRVESAGGLLAGLDLLDDDLGLDLIELCLPLLQGHFGEGSLHGVLGPVLDPVLDLLGIGIAEADVAVTSIEIR